MSHRARRSAQTDTWHGMRRSPYDGHLPGFSRSRLSGLLREPLQATPHRTAVEILQRKSDEVPRGATASVYWRGTSWFLHYEAITPTTLGTDLHDGVPYAFGHEGQRYRICNMYYRQHIALIRRRAQGLEGGTYRAAAAAATSSTQPTTPALEFQSPIQLHSA